ncbi:hypothetical protein [Virgibacillus doumboii]|uniref:hypothetical protein n=1 Tax=Virgibacillus doumboii TaxID=2697503 RepID=UPI0013DF84BF|nr:hypothetical protein [Virgibacillus doumboii]
MRLLRIVVFYLFGVFGIICISVFSQFFSENGLSNLLNYFQDLATFIANLFQPDFWEYKLTTIYTQSKTDFGFPILETLWEPYIYSMQIFFGAILSGFILAFLLTLLSSYLPQSMLKGLKGTLDFLESVPDLVIAVLLQALTIFAYKNTPAGNPLFTRIR